MRSRCAGKELAILKGKLQYFLTRGGRPAGLASWGRG